LSYYEKTKIFFKSHTFLTQSIITINGICLPNSNGKSDDEGDDPEKKKMLDKLSGKLDFILFKTFQIQIYKIK
jgi:hypothetical protein